MQLVLAAGAHAATKYWDPDNYYYDNDHVTGAGLGGSGTWDSFFGGGWATPGSPASWSSGDLAAFWGEAGVVTVEEPFEYVSGLRFLTDGYRVTGAKLIFNGAATTTLDVQAAGAIVENELGVNSGVVQEVVKTGPGTLTLPGAVTMNRPLTIAQGAVAVPGGTQFPSQLELHGGALRVTSAGAGSVFSQLVSLDVGAAGGGIDVPSATANVTFSGSIRGDGTLTKSGAGELRYVGPGSTIDRLRVTGGIFAATNGGFGEANTTRADAITLDGGGIGNPAGTGAVTLPPAMGVTLGAAGGTLRAHSGGNLLVHGDITGPGGLTIPGAGNVWLGSNVSDYHGPTTIAGGRLIAGSIGDGSAANALVFDGGEFVANNNFPSPNLSSALRPIVVNAGGGKFNPLGRHLLAASVSGTGDFEKSDNGSLTAAHVRVADVTVSGGRLAVAPSGGAAAGTSVVASVAVSGGGQLDLADNKLVVTNMFVGSWDDTHYTGVAGLVEAGRNGGAWDGSGIMTSQTHAPTALTALAVARAGDTAYANATFGGVSVANDDVLVMYTYGGDADLSGALDSDDYFAIDSNFNQSGSVFGYSNGDFDYNGAIDSDDYFIIDSNFNNQVLGQFPSAAFAGGEAAAVPEPTSAAVCLFASLVTLLATRRSRRRRSSSAQPTAHLRHT